MENSIKGLNPSPPIMEKNKVIFSKTRPFLSTFVKTVFSPLKKLKVENDPGRVFVMAAEFLNITEKTGMVNLTVRFSVMKSW